MKAKTRMEFMSKHNEAKKEKGIRIIKKVMGNEDEMGYIYKRRCLVKDTT